MTDATTQRATYCAEIEEVIRLVPHSFEEATHVRRALLTAKDADDPLPLVRYAIVKARRDDVWYAPIHWGHANGHPLCEDPKHLTPLALALRKLEQRLSVRTS